MGEKIAQISILRGWRLMTAIWRSLGGFEQLVSNVDFVARYWFYCEGVFTMGEQLGVRVFDIDKNDINDI